MDALALRELTGDSGGRTEIIRSADDLSPATAGHRRRAEPTVLPRLPGCGRPATDAGTRSRCRCGPARAQKVAREDGLLRGEVRHVRASELGVRGLEVEQLQLHEHLGPVGLAVGVLLSGRHLDVPLVAGHPVGRRPPATLLWSGVAGLSKSAASTAPAA